MMCKPFDLVANYLQSLPTDAAALLDFYDGTGAGLLRDAEAAWELLDGTARNEVAASLSAVEPQSDFGRIAQRSFLSALTNDPAHLRAVVELYDSDDFKLEVQYFLHWQTSARGFRYPGSVDSPTAQRMLARYRKVVAAYARAIGAPKQLLAPAQRNWSIVPIVTLQMIGRAHAPTADVLDYARALKQSGRLPYIINAALIPRATIAPFYAPTLADHVDQYAQSTTLTHEDAKYDFYQPDAKMPDLDEIARMVGAIQMLRPGFVLACGNSNLVADICAAFTTVVTIPFATELQVAASNLYVLPRAPREGDDRRIAEAGFTRQQVLSLEYTFRIPASQGAMTRASIGVSDDSMVLVVIGNRLGDDAAAEWIAQLADFVARNDGIEVVFAGKFTAFESRVAPHPALRARSRYVGFCDDVPALLALCDGYLNPPRLGGGSTAAYALAAGLAVFSEPAGDVANIAGAARHDATWPRIAEVLGRRRDDPAYRESDRARSVARFGAISDRAGMIERIVRFAEEGAEIRVTGVPA